jgi:lipopolysaccharide heptosyltransferase I
MMTDFLIIRLSSLGDIIHTLPAFAALRRHFPGSRIEWAVQGKGKQILDLVPGLDGVLEVAPRSWKLFSGRFRSDLKRIRSTPPDRGRIALDFQGLLKSGLMARLSGARIRVGFARENLRERSAALFYTRRIPPFPDDIHIIRKNLRLLEAVDIQERSFEFPIKIPERIRQKSRDLLESMGHRSERPLVLLNVGAAWPNKRWSPTGWREVASQLERRNYFPLLLWGNEEEKKLAETAAADSGISVAPPLEIPEVLALILEARLLISGDTFALQAACALDRPVVALFGPTTPGRNGPFHPGDHVVHHELPCSHCYRRSCPETTCMKKITPLQVIEHCWKALEPNA